MLIVGGLIVVAVLALVGAFLLARSGGKPAQSAPSSQESVATAAPREQPAPAEEKPANTRPLAPEPMPQVDVKPTLEETPTAALPAVTSEPSVATGAMEPLRQEIKLLQDHIYQLTEQLQVLNSHTQEIEQRLSHTNGTPLYQRSEEAAEGPQLPFPEESQFGLH